MGRKRRRARSGQRPAAGSGSASQQALGQPARRGGPIRRLRRQIDSFGGLLTVGAITAALVIVVVLVIRSTGSGGLDPSSDPLMGDEVPISSAQHIDPADADEMDIEEGLAPAGGPHFAVPQNPGIYDEPIADGNAVHSLEHGIIWISYNPDLTSDTDLKTLRSVASSFDNDVILSPRPENAQAIDIVSWGRRLTFDTADAATLESFVRTNVNRSPEPGVR